METKYNVKWKVSLNNGETLYEGKGDFIEIAGELSPWNRLLYYLDKTGSSITSLCLYTDSGHTFNLPSSGKNPKFKEFSDIEKPRRFNFFHKIAHDINTSVRQTEITDLYAVIEAVYANYKLQLWVDELNSRNCWGIIIHG